jgi:hypothetical protein
VIDGHLRLLVLEGLRGGSLPLLEAKLREQQCEYSHSHSSSVKILMNPDLRFRDRLYGTLGADVQVDRHCSKIFYEESDGCTFWQRGSEKWNWLYVRSFEMIVAVTSIGFDVQLHGDDATKRKTALPHENKSVQVVHGTHDFVTVFAASNMVLVVRPSDKVCQLRS